MCVRIATIMWCKINSVIAVLCFSMFLLFKQHQQKNRLALKIMCLYTCFNKIRRRRSLPYNVVIFFFGMAHTNSFLLENQVSAVASKHTKSEFSNTLLLPKLIHKLFFAFSFSHPRNHWTKSSSINTNNNFFCSSYACGVGVRVSSLSLNVFHSNILIVSKNENIFWMVAKWEL